MDKFNLKKTTGEVPERGREGQQMLMRRSQARFRSKRGEGGIISATARQGKGGEGPAIWEDEKSSFILFGRKEDAHHRYRRSRQRQFFKREKRRGLGEKIVRRKSVCLRAAAKCRGRSGQEKVHTASKR